MWRFLSAVVLLFFAMSAAAQDPCDPPPPEEDVEECSYACSPIVINLAHGTYRLTGAESPVAFDIRNTGQPV